MANLDTRQKRASGVMPNLSFRSMLPVPDGALNQGDRQQTAFVYAGIAASPYVPPDVSPMFWNRHRPGPVGR